MFLMYIIRMDGKSLDIKQAYIAALREMFPCVFSEYSVNEAFDLFAKITLSEVM